MPREPFRFSSLTGPALMLGGLAALAAAGAAVTSPAESETADAAPHVVAFLHDGR